MARQKMRTIVYYLLNILAVGIVTLVISCNGTDTLSAGGGTGSEVGFVRGKLFDTCGNPAKNAVVTIRPGDYLSPVDKDNLGKRKTASPGGVICSTRTNGNGVYAFSRDNFTNAGVYSIEAWSEHGNSSIFITDIDIKAVHTPVWYNIDTPFVHTDRTLRPPVSLAGTVLPMHDSATTHVRIFGLDACVAAGTDGTFRFDSLPQGAYLLQIVTIRTTSSFDTLNAEAVNETTILPDTIVPSLYRVIYSGNGSTSGAVPVDKRGYDDGEIVTVTDAGSSLLRAGYVFAGWNTRADGSGTMYQAGDTLTKGGEGISLYAQWAENRYWLTVAADGNGSVRGTDSVAYSVPHTITAAPDIGNNFTGWRVKNGTADIADAASAATTVSLKGGDAAIEAVFTPVETFIRTFDGMVNPGACVRQTSDSGFAMIGNTGSDSAHDILLVKTSADGTVLWTRTYGSSGNDEAYSLLQTRDDGYIIAGSTTSFGAGSADAYLIRTNNEGDTVWTNTYGSAGDDAGYSVVQTEDGGFIFVGYSSYDDGVNCGYIVKVDANGNTLWAITPGDGEHWGKAYSIQPTDDGNYIAIGNRQSPYKDGYADVWIAKSRDIGDTLWTKAYKAPDFHWALDVKQTDDEGYIIVGCTMTENDFTYPLNSNEIYLLKTDEFGDTLWTKRYNDFPVGEGRTVLQTADGGYLIGGSYQERPSVTPGFLLKTTATGEKSWSIRFGDTENSSIGPILYMQHTIDGGYIIGAADMSLIKTDALGRIVDK